MRRLSAAVLLCSLALDHLTKWWAQAHLVEGACLPEACVSVFGTPVRLHLIYNTGAAFSAGEGFGWLLAPLATAVAAFLLALAWSTQDRRLGVGYSLVASGALGNVIDRVVRAEHGFATGGVVDFIDLRVWPIFNLADVAVVIGVALLLLLQGPRRREVSTLELPHGSSTSRDTNRPTV